MASNGIEDTSYTVDSDKKKQGGPGGFTCCVPSCYNNNKARTDLSFYAFPNGKSKDKQLLRRRWINMVSRKDFKPTAGHRVCSEHFVGGRKTYMSNVPTLVPKNSRRKSPCKRTTTKARKRVFVDEKSNDASGPEDSDKENATDEK